MSETTERAYDAWARLPEKGLLPTRTRKLIDAQVETTATNIRRAFS